MEKEVTFYTLVFSDGKKTVCKFVKLPKEFVQLIPYCTKLMSSGMIDADKSTIRIEHPVLTDELVKAYMQHLKWRFGGYVGPDPAGTCDPYLSVIAEYLNDDMFFVDVFSGDTIEIMKKEIVRVVPSDEDINMGRWWIHPYDKEEHLPVFKFEVPAGLYGSTNDNAIETLLTAICKQIENVIQGTESEIINSQAQLTCPAEYIFKTNGNVKIFRQKQSGIYIVKPKMTPRKYLNIIHDDFPKYLSGEVAGTLSDQYVRSIADGKGNGYRKLAKFVSQNVTVAKIIWSGNEVTVCEMLRVPKSSHNKISKMIFDDIYRYADSVAKSKEPEPGFDFSNDSIIKQLQDQIDKLYEKFAQMKHRYDHITSRCGLKTREKIRDEYDMLDIVDPFTIREQIDKLEAEWWNRYEVLAAKARKNQPLRRPISTIY